MKPFLVLVLGFLLSATSAFAVPTTLSVVDLSQTAAAFADNAADTANGNQVRNLNCDTVLLFRNTHATNSSTATVTSQSGTFVVPGVGSVQLANLSVVLAAGAVKHIGPFPCKGFTDTSGYIQITYSGTGTVLVSPIRVPKNF
jgi:hypothetical protein